MAVSLIALFPDTTPVNPTPVDKDARYEAQIRDTHEAIHEAQSLLSQVGERLERARMSLRQYGDIPFVDLERDET